ncbi:biotin transporter BioY [Geomicrobium sp. JCM 19039]|uniref:biotin transporter BioY n=1 Tax=Geomicrobium sp. JCM 19039 TaxID=1460636 RepID=UPI00045F2315|nr:biotin transporter BioY [Geomicrobium sp. JCM 19039]GAK13745.1 substrate-specific component BioY of biotin ECF transporter [Geomicrobium sp. JCM 19039]
MRAYDMILVSMFVALMSVGANITSMFPFLVIFGVPLTFQSFIAILTGAILGSKRGALAMGLYALVGLAGAPIFTQFHGGIGMLVRPTFGFVLSFIVLAFVVGKIIERKQHPSFLTYLVASMVGLLINYIIGTNWMYGMYSLGFQAPDNFTYSLVWLWMLLPFVKDIILTVMAASIAYKLVAILPQRTASTVN